MRFQNGHSEQGVEMVELALILPVLILICFGVVDLLRLSYFEAMLKRTASDIAVKVRVAPNLDYDLREFTTNSGEYYDFLEARKRALAAGLLSASMTFTQPGVPSDAQLIGVTQLDSSLGNYAGPPPVSWTAAAAILRPGEQAMFSYVDGSGRIVNDIIQHPIMPPFPDGKMPVQKMEILLQSSPIHIELRALVHPLLHFVLGDRVVRGSVTTYRENGIRRTPMVDPANGADLAPSTATRKGKGLDEVWLTSPEPLEPPPVPAYGWAKAFRDSAGFGGSLCAKTTSENDTRTCPPGL